MQEDRNIENIFNEQFNAANVTNEGWNDPSDKIWSRIENDIEKTPREKFGYLPFLLSSFLVLTLVGLGYLMHKNEELNNKLIETQKELQVCGEKENTVKGQYIESNLELSSVIPSTRSEREKADQNFLTALHSSKETLTNLEAHSVTIKKLENGNTRKDYMSQSEVHHYSGLKNQKNEVVTKSIDIDKDKFIESPENTYRKELDIHEIASINAHISDKSEIVIYPKITEPIKTPNKLSPSKLYTITGIANGSLINRGVQTTPLTELIDTEKGASGYNLEMGYAHRIGKNWSFRSGVGVDQLNFVTEYDVTLEYNNEDESVVGEEGFIDFVHSLPTSFGNTDTGLRLSRARSTSNVDEPSVLLDFDTRHTITNLYVPLDLRYEKTFGSISIGVGPRIAPSYIVNATSGIDQVVSHHSEISSSNNFSTSNYNLIQNVNLGIGGTISVGYPVGRFGEVILHGAYTQNAFTHFTRGNFNSRMSKLNVNAGYVYQF